MDDMTFITKDGLDQLNAELEDLKKNKRREIADRIRAAKELGDLSENAEYHEAKDEQGFVEGKIAELQHIIKTANVIEKHHSDKIEVGSTFKVKSEQGTEMTYTIVGSRETDPAGGKISNASPIGKAFLGHKAGDKVEVSTPRGTTEFEVVSIE